MKFDDIYIWNKRKEITIYSAFEDKNYIIKSIENIYDFLNRNLGTKKKILLIKNSYSIPNSKEINEISFNYSLGCIYKNDFNLLKYSLNALVLNFAKISHSLFDNTPVNMLEAISEETNGTMNVVELEKFVKSNTIFKKLSSGIIENKKIDLNITPYYTNLKLKYTKEINELKSSNNRVRNLLLKELTNVNKQIDSLLKKKIRNKEMFNRKSLIELKISRLSTNFNRMKQRIDQKYSFILTDMDKYVNNIDTLMEKENIKLEKIINQENDNILKNEKILNEENENKQKHIEREKLQMAERKRKEKELLQKKAAEAKKAYLQKLAEKKKLMLEQKKRKEEAARVVMERNHRKKEEERKRKEELLRKQKEAVERKKQELEAKKRELYEKQKEKEAEAKRLAIEKQKKLEEDRIKKEKLNKIKLQRAEKLKALREKRKLELVELDKAKKRKLYDMMMNNSIVIGDTSIENFQKNNTHVNMKCIFQKNVNPNNNTCRNIFNKKKGNNVDDFKTVEDVAELMTNIIALEKGIALSKQYFMIIRDNVTFSEDFEKKFIDLKFPSDYNIVRIVDDDINTFKLSDDIYDSDCVIYKTSYVKNYLLKFCKKMIGIYNYTLNKIPKSYVIGNDLLRIGTIFSFLKNKRVVIVGPSEHVNNGEYIDNFDVVVRCNQGHKLTKLPEKYGSRTDILYHCVSQSDTCGGSLNGINTRFIRFSYPKLASNEAPSFKLGNLYEYKKIHTLKKMSMVDKEKYIKFEKELRCRPNCGTVAIWDLLQYDIEELYITGFTLFQTEYHELYKKQRVDSANMMMKKVGAHNQELIKKYYQIMINDIRVNYDEEFKKSIDISFIQKFKNKILIEKKYSLNYKYNSIYSNRKLIYNIYCKKNESIVINNSIIINFDKNSLYNIYLENNQYVEYIDSKKNNVYDKLNNIEYINNESYDISIIIPLSLCNILHESLINLDYILKKYLTTKLNINICISHTEKAIDSFLDDIIIDNKINYIFVKNPYYFNLGYNRNLWKYINNSKKIMFIDIDIPLDEHILEDLIIKSKKYDIVKPYENKLIHLTLEEKYKYLNDNIIPDKDPFCLFTISGGITLFDKKILLETGGYIELFGYGYEDRYLDVLILNRKYKIKLLDYKIIHLYHLPSRINEDDNNRTRKIHQLLWPLIRCKYEKLATNDLHEKCNHNSFFINFLEEIGKKYYGNINLDYKNVYVYNMDNLNNIIILENYNKKYLNNLFIREFENNKLYLKQLVTRKYLHNNKLSYKKQIANTKLNIKEYMPSIKLKAKLINEFKFNKNYYKNLINKKRVVVVGPADYVNNNELIDSYDIIVRINKGNKMVLTGKHGSRTDVLYHVVNQHHENGGPIDYSAKYHTRFVYPILDIYDKTSFYDIGTLRDYATIYYSENHINNFSIIDEDKYIKFENICESRPNSGLTAILDLLLFDLKEIYITGFTLFQTNYDSSYRDKVDNKKDSGNQALKRMKDQGHHDQYKSAKIFKNIILKDKRVKYDKILEECIDNTLNSI